MAGPDDDTPGAPAEEAEEEENEANSTTNDAEDNDEPEEPEDPEEAEEAEGRPARKKARTRSQEYVYDDEDGGDDTDDSAAAASSSSDDGPDPIDPFINSAVALSRGRIHFASAPQAAVGALLNSQNEDGSAPRFAYSWDSILGLDLGGGSNHVVGTAAMAQHISSQGGGTDRGLTPSQIAEMVRTHRPRTCRPPDGSGLVDVVHNAPSENALWYGDEKTGGKSAGLSAAMDQVALEVDRKIGAKSTPGGGQDLIVPYSTLARLYETMCQQDATSPEVDGDGESSFRRECRFMTAPKVVETLRQYENGMTELDKRERDIMEVGKELGLLGNDGKDGVGSDVAKYLGYSSTS